MEDLERGTRVKELRRAKAERLGRRVTQADMAEAVDVSLRAAQEWEYGGGIDDEHLPALLEFLETDADYLLRGNAPDLIATLDPEAAEKEQLDRIERKMDEILKRLPAEEPPALPPDEPIPPKREPDREDTDAEATG